MSIFTSNGSKFGTHSFFFYNPMQVHFFYTRNKEKFYEICEWDEIKKSFFKIKIVHI